MGGNDDKPGSDHQVMQDILKANLIEQRRGRRWKNFYRFSVLAYLSLLSWHFLSDPVSQDVYQGSEKHVAVVDLNGEIAAKAASGVSAERLVGDLTKAFKDESAVAVMLRVNSPGGSPVQSARVYRAIMRLKEQGDMPVYAVAGDITASGAYYIASAADFIYADPSSLVGSVGVIMGGFGFSGIMDKLGIERRVYTAGKYKSFLDPYSEENPQMVAHAQSLLDNIHSQFITDVRTSRGDRLHGNDGELFNGLVWTGEQALELGLIDGLGSPREVADEQLGTTEMVDYTSHEGGLQSLLGRIGVSFVSEATDFLTRYHFQ